VNRKLKKNAKKILPKKRALGQTMILLIIRPQRFTFSTLPNMQGF